MKEVILLNNVEGNTRVGIKVDDNNVIYLCSGGTIKKGEYTNETTVSFLTDEEFESLMAYNNLTVGDDGFRKL